MGKLAVTLAGVPGRISSAVLAALRERYNDGYVFRAPGAKLYNDRLARYDEKAIDDIVENARDAVFGKTKRPSSFCRNRGLPCALINGPRHGCGQTPDSTCVLEKPDYCLVLYHEGMLETELLKRLHFSAFTLKIERECYDRFERTVAAAVEALAVAKATLPALSQEMLSGSTPLLLPPTNFGMDDLHELLSSAASGKSRTGLIKQFRAERFGRASRAYEGRSGLAFKPASLEVRHGRAGPQEKADLALSHHFRLGCPYPDEFHYDVTRLDGRDMGGKIKFFCRIIGTTRPKGRNVNVLVDDCIRP